MNETEFLYNYLPEDLSVAIKKTDGHIKDNLFEIRLRRSRAVVLFLLGKSFYLEPSGEITQEKSENVIKISDEDFDETFMRLCGHSLYSALDSLKRGYITLSNGSRVGVCMTAVLEKDNVTSVRDAASLNIRIPRELKGCSDLLCDYLFSNGLKSVLVASRVSGGKTTLLRDIARNLSERMYKVTVVDERNEIGAKKGKIITADLGDNTDVLTFYPKEVGTETAVRTLSPDVIILDEAANDAEAKAISYAFSCGVKFILSVHASNTDELKNKKIVSRLLSTNEFSYVVLIDCGFEYKIYDVTDGEINENYRSTVDNSIVCNERRISYKNCS